MGWTGTHRFVILAMHVAHQGDERLQVEEQRALTEACTRLGTDSHVPPPALEQMVIQACRAYQQARANGMEQALVDEASDVIGATFSQETCLRLLRELRGIAMAYGGVNPHEHAALVALREAWGIRSLA